MENTARQFELRDYLRIVSKRKWFILLVTMALTLVGGLYAVSYRATYQASALVLIRREPLQRIRFFQGQEIEPPETLAQYTLDTQCQIATSHNAAKRTALRLQGRTSGQRIVADAIEIKQSIAATPQEPDRILIRATNEERTKAIAFANETAETFTAIISELRNSEVRQAREFLEQQSEEVSNELDNLVRKLAMYQQQAGIVVPEVEAQATMEDLRDYTHALDEAISQLQELMAQKQVLERQLREARQQPVIKTDTEKPNPEREMLEGQLRQEQLQLATLLAKYKRDHPAVAQVERRIQSLEARINRLPDFLDTTTVETNARIRQLEGQLHELDVRIAQNQKRVARLEEITGRVSGNASDLPLELADIDRLQNRIGLLRTTYQNFMTQLEQTRLRDAIEPGGATVIDQALDAREIKPKPGRVLIFAFALGLFAAFMLALLLEALDDTFHSPEDIKYYTDVPFLGMIPLLESAGDELITISAPKSPPAEAYRVLRSHIHFAQVENPARTFIVTSAGAGEGKSLTVANLAVVFAQAGQSVLLVDSDLRRPVQHRLFGIGADRGLTTALVGETTLDELVRETEVPGLSILPSGPLPPNPADLLNSDQMDEILRQGTTQYDIVLLDTPPAVVLTDAVLLASKVDQALLVAECDHVSRSAFQEMVRLIRNARGNILGVVLNKLRLSTTDYYYYYYYYDYYSQEPPGPDVTEEQRETASEPAPVEPGPSDTVPPDFEKPAEQESEQAPEAPMEKEQPQPDESDVDSDADRAESSDDGADDANGLLDDLLGLNGDDE
ncbi:MAG: polysaccharide biosynthesis tyrosine autokinase [Armatimonadota bacterium]